MRITLLLLSLLSFSAPAVAQQVPYPQVVAKAGDGIYLLLRRHGLDPSLHMSSFMDLNKENIGKGNSLYTGRTYLLPIDLPEAGKSEASPEEAKEEAASLKAAPGVTTYVPLFGEKYARVEVLDQQLKGAVYYLVSGHGGPDPGAIGKYGPYMLAEDEYAYDVTARLARRLMQHGATVYMIIQDENDGIRDKAILEIDRDEVNYPSQKVSLNQRERLQQRTEAINQLHAKHKGGAYQRMLSIHVDSRSKGQNIDVFFYHHENSSSGQKLAQSIHQTFTTNYNRHQPNRDYSGTVSDRSSLYVIKYSNPPTVFIELGNIKNDLDQRRFVLPNNRQALANWITEGIIADYRSK